MKMFNFFSRKTDQEIVKRPSRNLKEISDLLINGVQQVTIAMTALEEIMGNVSETNNEPVKEEKPRKVRKFTPEGYIELRNNGLKVNEKINTSPEEAKEGVEMLRSLIARHSTLNQTAEFCGFSTTTIANLINRNPASMRKNTYQKIKVAHEKLNNNNGNN